ncbi:SDR family oxidoreductase [Petroclostridium sp. X23]|uniref:SDR family NAD(P)-dependent oxidoreductase n=1 Tax=Petroclostridium sp. X23 TaxID=3045146 RepID=UPI0024ACF090|nr:SDR family oxidoreductase [Petroclostridium sp. X23]WHH61259.1 SDR family oxidoreductase [Petroclostridium sp. X23]
MQYYSLAGRAAIVTGAGHGIGRAAAIRLAELGAKVTVCDIDGESAEAVAKEIIEQGQRAIASKCNVCFLEDIQKTVVQTADAFGRVDILVNNAAGGGGGMQLSEVGYKEWDRLILLDLTSAYMFSKEALPYMMEQNYGKIVNISSGAGIVGDGTDIHYATAKAGLIGMTKSMAQQVAKYHINVNALGVGLTDTRMSRRRGLEEQIPSILWPRIGKPEDQANAIAFLVSDAAEYITGQVVCPNGGSWM